MKIRPGQIEVGANVLDHDGQELVCTVTPPRPRRLERAREFMHATGAEDVRYQCDADFWTTEGEAFETTIELIVIRLETWTVTAYVRNDDLPVLVETQAVEE